LNDTSFPPLPGATIVPRSEHAVSRSQISANALKVLYRLKKAGFAAYVVGGGVRDLLLGLDPKDFDIVTDAHPEEVRRLFRNSRMIGRRFRLVHVRFGHEIIEVATFRSSADGDDADREHHAESGRILRDNVYGTIDEDIWRRDFTVNALYYNIADFSVWDYTTGFEDVRSGTLRLIGDPATRYREDPVRMLRAVRLAAKLSFGIADETAEPIREHAALLEDVPPARLFDEVLKLFLSGHAEKSFELLEKYGLFRYLFPATAHILSGPEGKDARALISRGLANTDARIVKDMPVTPMFLFAIMLWPAIRKLSDELLADGDHTPLQATTEAIFSVLAAQQSSTSLPKRYGSPMREILQMQHRFEQKRGARAARLLEHKRFRAAYDFMLLRAACGEISASIADFWTEIQDLPAGEVAEKLGRDKRRSRSRGRGRKRKKHGAASTRVF